MKTYRLYYKTVKTVDIYNKKFNDVEKLAIEFNKLCDDETCEWAYATKIKTEHSSGDSIEKLLVEYRKN